MAKSKYRQNIDDLTISQITHSTAIKKIFISKHETGSVLTQFAWSKFKPVDTCEKHRHYTMDEYFYVLKGKGIYIIEDEKLHLRVGDFIRIPAGTNHQFVNDSDDAIEFLYFGIELNGQSI